MAWKAPQMLSPPRVHHWHPLARILHVSLASWSEETPNVIRVAVIWYDISYWYYIQLSIYIYINTYRSFSFYTYDIPCYLLVSIVMMYRYFIAFQSARLPFSMHYLLLYHPNQSLCDGSLSLGHLYSSVHSLKLTAKAPEKLDAWNTIDSFWGPAYFQVLLLMDKILHHLGWLIQKILYEYYCWWTKSG